MSISTKEIFEALLLDVLQGYDITPRFATGNGAKMLGRFHLANRIAGVLSEIEGGQVPSREEAAQRNVDEWNRIIQSREAEVGEHLKAEFQRLQQAQQMFQEQVRRAQRPTQQQQGEVWKQYEEEQKKKT
jgi:hypothetical protein